ncbi:zinc finger (CCCH type) protein [Novymonas esmeraldas]|uniref:Zinc finger (CCCH type) protein n=1 Tax=Novymonas esmeraldas TaxID=1808958 RepID=A0AAW0ES73_9TRYP
MPKANKHAEVKPSKYKTSLCQFFAKGEACPYAGRCAFAHGDHELQSEASNVELLKVTGLQRLDGADKPRAEVPVAESHTPSSNSITDSVVSEPLVLASPVAPTSPVVRPRRRTIMVSLPKHNTRSDTYPSPYAAQHYDPSYGEYGYPMQNPQSPQTHGSAAAYMNLYTQTAAVPDNQYCDCRFSATCSQGQPSKYRHNPYGMTGRIAQCA